MSAEGQVFPEFVQETRRYILINSDPKPILTKAGGVPFRIPARDEVVEFNKEDPTGFISATDTDESYIPGTLVVKDVYKTDRDGADVLAFDAGVAVRTLLGINNKQGRATSILATRGLSLLPAGSTREKLEEIREGGLKRSEKWRVEQARFLVQEIDGANAKRKRHNQPELTPDEDYTQAVLLLRAVRGKDQQRLAAMLSGPDVVADERLMKDIKEDVNVDEADELMEMLRAKAKEVLPDTAPPEDMHKLVNMILESPEGMRILRSQYKMRKHAAKRKRAAEKTETGVDADGEAEEIDYEAERAKMADQGALERIHGRPAPVADPQAAAVAAAAAAREYAENPKGVKVPSPTLVKKEANLPAKDKAALREQAHAESSKGTAIEHVEPGAR